MSTKQGFITKCRGFTILELVIVMMISAIGVALAVPTYQDVMQRRETTAQAEGLVAFMSFAQSEAIKYNKLISVHLAYTGAKNWCIGANEGNAPCDCKVTNTAAANFCSLNDVAKIMRSSEKTRSGMATASTDRTLVFDSVRGTMIATDLGTDHNVTLESGNGNWSLTIDIEATGRFRICNPAPAQAVPGYPSC
jgi:type IV fimbrial biogenesis protein FimT